MAETSSPERTNFAPMCKLMPPDGSLAVLTSTHIPFQLRSRNKSSRTVLVNADRALLDPHVELSPADTKEHGCIANPKPHRHDLLNASICGRSTVLY